MLEQMNDGISVIIEGQTEIKGRLGIIEGKVDNLEVRFDNLEVKVDIIDARLVQIENRLIRVEDDVIEIKHRLSEKVDRDEFHKMEKRMVKLEKLVFARLG